MTNSGNSTLTSVITVSDNKIASVTCPALPSGGLAPNAFITCTAAYIATQTDVDNGSVTNFATAKSGTVTSQPSSVSVPSVQSPALTIAKTSTTTAYGSVGMAITYSYKVTNAGNVTLTSGVSVSDNKIASVTCPALPLGGLAPGSSVTCTGVYTTKQSDLDAGSIVNTASAKSGSVTSPNATLTIVASQTPALTLVKTSTATGFNATGLVIPYAYKVTNTGNTTLSSPISVTDNKIATVACPALPPGGLVPGASVTCNATYTTTQADIDAGTLTNIAQAKSGALVSPPSSVTITATQSPALGLAKTSTATTFTAVGDVLPYSYKVTNTGNVTLTSAITITDSKIAAVTCPSLPAGGLQPTAFITCTASYTVVQADLDSGTVLNTATAKSAAVTSPTVSLTIAATQRPNFTVVKSAVTPVAVNNGDGSFTATFKVVLTNTGNVSLADVQLTDDYGAQLPKGAKVLSASIKTTGSSVRGPLSTANAAYTATAASPNLLRGVGETLAVAEVITSTFDIRFDPGTNASGANFGNVVIAKTIFGLGTPLAQTASRSSQTVIPFVANKPLQVSKTTPKTDVTRGELVPYSITVRNSGDVARTGLTLVDNIPAGFKYRLGSATIDGIAREPAVNGRVLTWNNVTITTTKPVILKLMLIAGTGIGMGEFTNEAWVADTGGTVVSNIGKATVRMIGDPTFDCTDIIGKVFDDVDRSGYADDGKRGIANVRLATARGQLVTTDSEGRYHIACADIPESDRGTNFILKLDERTLPTGYRVTTENPRVIRITAGKMSKINFGAAATRVARLDLADAAFEPGTNQLKQQWAQGFEKVLAQLRQEKSVLRIAYRRRGNEPAALADTRVSSLAATLQQMWKREGGSYVLVIETEVTIEKAASR